MGRRKSLASSRARNGVSSRPATQREQEAREKERPVRAERKARDGERRGEQGQVAAHAIFAGAEHLVTAFLQRLDGFDAGGVARGNQGRSDAGSHAHRHGEDQERGIDDYLLNVLRRRRTWIPACWRRRR